MSFDVAAVNPINVGPPTRHALNAEDISTPDIGKLRRILRRPRERIRPGGHKPIWATEIWWDSRPPDPRRGRAANAGPLAGAVVLRALEAGGASVVWFLIRDQAKAGDFAATVQTASTSPTAGRSPPTGVPLPVRRRPAEPRLGAGVGEAPGAGPVEVQRKRGRWLEDGQAAGAGSNRVFTGKVNLRGSAQLRARAGGETSLAWKQGAG